jgi:hypothetical protein
MWDFRSFHVRAINAGSETEKAAINAELKATYEKLNDEDKVLFNTSLQAFLVKQYKNLGDDYENINGNEHV